MSEWSVLAAEDGIATQSPSPDTRQVAARQADIIDADYQVVQPAEPAGRLVTDISASPAHPSDVPSLDGMEMLRSAQLNTTRQPERRTGPLFWASGVCLALVTFWIAGGHAIIRPALAELGAPSPKPLRIASVISQVDRSGTRPIIQIDGKAVNDGKDAVALPSLEIQIVSTAGSSTLYKLGTAGRSLEGGGFFDFSSRLDMPKDGVRTVFVTFSE